MSQIIVKVACHLTTFNDLNAIQFAYSQKKWEANLQSLLNLLNLSTPNSLSLAPELCLSAYSYENMDNVAEFSKYAIPKILQSTKDKTLGLTLTVKENGNFYNRFMLFDNEKIIYTQDKAKLFPLGNEPKHFNFGTISNIKPFTCKDLKIGVLICFELRFTELWQQLKGCDIILVPAFWGKSRKEHFETLSQALAIINQCFVIVSNSTDEDMCSSSAIIDPFGKLVRDDSKNHLSMKFDKKIIKKMRRYIDIGL